MEKKHYMLLDIYRFLASVAVFLYHIDTRIYPFLENLENGFLGVDFFFVLSGFVITNMVIPDVLSGSFKPKLFLLRRLARLMPGILVLNLLLLPTASGQIDVYLSGIFFSVFYLSDIYPVMNFLCGNSLEYPINVAQCWSLAVEEQFYILFSFTIRYYNVVVNLFNRRLYLIFLIFLIITVISEYVMGKWFYKFPLWRMCEILLGVLISLFRLFDNVLIKKLCSKIYPVIVSLILIFYLLKHNDISKLYFPLIHIIFALLSFLLVLFSVAWERNMQNNSLRKLIVKLAFLGKYSYGLYLYHLALFLVVPRFLNFSQELEYGIVSCMLLLISFLSYHLVENPIKIYVNKKISILEKSL